MRHPALTLSFALLVAAPLARAQDIQTAPSGASPDTATLWRLAPEVRPGWRLRVHVPEDARQIAFQPRRQWLRGTVARLAPDTVYLDVPGTAGSVVAVPSDSVRELWRSRGVPSRGTSFLRGAVAGALGGALIGAAWIWLDEGNHEFYGQRSAGEAAQAGAAIGALYVGAVSFLSPVERWKRVKLHRARH